jgi:hypothetical protein
VRVTFSYWVLIHFSIVRQMIGKVKKRSRKDVTKSYVFAQTRQFQWRAF